MADNERFYANGSSVDQDTGKGLKTGVAQIILPNVSQVPPAAAKPPAKVSPLGGKKSEAAKELTMPVVARVPEEKLHVTTAKVHEEKLPAPVAKSSEEKISIPTAKVPEEKLHVTTTKVHGEKLPVHVTKSSEEKIPKVSEEKLPVHVAKVPEEKLPVPTAKLSEEKLPIPVAIVPEETVPVATAKVPEEKLPTSVGGSSIVVSDPVSSPSVGGHHVGAVSADNEASENDKSSLLTAIPVSVKEELSSGFAVAAVEIHPADDGTDGAGESKASEPVVPCPTSADAVVHINLHQHQEIPPLMPHSVSNEQSCNAHSKIAAELLEGDAVASDAVPATEVSSQDEGLVDKTDEFGSKLGSGEESLSCAYPDVKIEASSVSREETSVEKLEVIPSTTISPSPAVVESSAAEKFHIAEVACSQRQDESAVEERKDVQTEVSPPCLSELAHDVITTEPNSEMPVTDETDKGCSQGSSDLHEAAEIQVSLLASDSHQGMSDSKLHEPSDSEVVSLDSCEPHHGTRDTAVDDSYIHHPEKSDVGHEHSDLFQELKSSVGERIEVRHESSETPDRDNLEKGGEAFERGDTVRHEESDRAHEVCDSGDGKKDSLLDEINSYSHDDHSGHAEKSDTSIEFIKPIPQVIDSSHKHDDGHQGVCSEIQEKNSSSDESGDDEGVVDMLTDEDLMSFPQDMSSSHQQKESTSPLECSEPLLEKDDSSTDKETGSSTLLVEVTGATEEKEGSQHEKRESSDERNDEHPEDTNHATSPDKKESSVLLSE